MTSKEVEIRKLLIQFNESKGAAGRRSSLKQLIELGASVVALNECFNDGSRVYTLFGVDSDGDVCYFASAGGTGSKSYTGNWTAFKAIHAVLANGDVVMLSAAKQPATAGAELLGVSEEDRTLYDSKTTDEVVESTSAVLANIKRLDDELAYQHVLKEHLRKVIQERISDVM